MILILITISIVYQLKTFGVFDVNLSVIAILTLLNVIAFFVFIYKILNTDKFEVEYINSLKYYSISYIICFLGNVVLSIIVEFNYQNLSFISNLLTAFPIIFIINFLIKFRNGELKNAST